MIIQNLQQPAKIARTMYSKCQLDSSIKEDIQAESTRHRKAEILVDHVMRGSYRGFQVFLDAIDQTGQTDLSEAIRNGNSELGKHSCLIFNLNYNYI